MTQNDPNRDPVTQDPVTGEAPVGGASGRLTGAPGGGQWSTAAKWIIVGFAALLVAFLIFWVIDPRW